jgi:acetyltransferase-like isoleucine patch superfamily enzyme
MAEEINKIDGLPENKYNPHAFIAGNPEIGEKAWIGAFTLIDGQVGLKIGKGCDIACGAHILTHSTAKRCVTEREYGVVDRAPVEIGDYVFIGESATILMGSKIGHHTIIGAGCLVTEHSVIPPYSLVVGVPAKVIRNIEQDIEKWKEEGRALNP